MGNNISPSIDNEEYPWFPIMMWVGESLPSSIVMKYSVSDIKVQILNLCDNKSVLIDKLINMHDTDIDLSYFRDSVAIREDKDARDFPLVDIASALLDVVPNLSTIRFELVPEEMSEEFFWERFLSLVKLRVCATVSE